MGFDEISHFIKEDIVVLSAHKREANRAVEIKPRASLFASAMGDPGPRLTRSQLLLAGLITSLRFYFAFFRLDERCRDLSPTDTSDPPNVSRIKVSRE